METPDSKPTTLSTSTVLWRALAALFTLGFIGGLAASLREDLVARDGSFATLHAVVLAAAAAASLIAIAVLLWPLRHARLPRSPRQRRSLIALIASVTVGAFIGFALELHGGDIPVYAAPFTSEAMISPTLAWVLVGAIVAAMALTVVWLANIDEHERAAYDFGSTAAIHAFFVLGPAWWLLSRAGLCAPVDGPILFAAIITVWLGAWLWRRYR